MNEKSQLKVLYEYYYEFNGADSDKTRDAINALLETIPKDKTDEIEDLLTTIGSSIREEAYSAGFKAAMNLMSEVNQVE